MPTILPQDEAPPTPARRPSSAPRSGASGRLLASDGGGFVPGTMLAQRFRVVSMLGRGGMGEVYRADDLELGQPVALKFLPKGALADPDALERFRGEVRNAREVAHPNVCRMYDIGEHEGRSFLSMEYIDGEDLASLLRRIGQLPRAKANEIAHQVCAGLAAAHARGVVHRDLKPSNILIDSRGQAHLTDFGLAVRAADGTREIAGTPPYMAPEQFAGEPATAQSDLYALGLVLYELYTGKRPFEANSLETWREKHAQAVPRSPMELSPGLDAGIERVVLRCLEKDQQKRPASAVAVAAALPGGNALAAVLAAGETPSPELVAASGEEGVLSPGRASLLLAAILVALAGVVFLSQHAQLVSLAAPGKSPEYLADRARDLATQLAGAPQVADSAWWFQTEPGGLARLGSVLSGSRYLTLRGGYPPVFWFVYRQSPRPLHADFPNAVSAQNPVPFYSGEVRVTLDPNGRLLEFACMPRQRLDPGVAEVTPSATDWQPFFAAAGLDAVLHGAIPATWIPEMPGDQQYAWGGEAAGGDFLVEAASFHGQPVYFRVLSLDARPLRMEGSSSTLASRIGASFFALCAAGILAVCFFFARRNVLSGRGDRRGAIRFGLVLFAVEFLSHLFIAHHIADAPAEFDWFELAFGHAAAYAIFFAAFYLALEPFIRRGWPEILVSWSRLVSGDVKNALVGRDLMIGILFGLILASLGLIGHALPNFLEVQGFAPVVSTRLLGSLPSVLGYVLGNCSSDILNSSGSLAILFVGWRLTRSKLASSIILAAFWAVVSFTGANAAVEIPLVAAMGILTAVCLVRVGFFPLMAALLVHGIFDKFPMTFELDHWYASRAIFLLAVLLAFAVFGFRSSLGARRLLATTDE